MKIDREKLIEFLTTHKEELIEPNVLLRECGSLKRRQRYNNFKSTLAVLEVGEKATFPVERYDSVRRSATRYGKEWGNKFTTKFTPENVIITRIV